MNWRKLVFGLLSVLVLYVGSYAILSATGGWVVSESGEVRMILAVSDIFEWQPRYGFCERFRRIGGEYKLRGDYLGYCFAPLILLDQYYVHRTVRFITLDGKMVDPLPAPPLSKYHPLISNQFSGRFPYEEGTGSKSR
jgi:hypothetical protein